MIAVRTGDEGGGGGRGDAGANADSGETHDASVDEASSRVLVDEEFGGDFSHSVGTLWSSDGRGGDDLGLERYKVICYFKQGNGERTKGPPYTAREEVNMNLMGFVFPFFRVASRRDRTESILT